MVYIKKNLKKKKKKYCRTPPKISCWPLSSPHTKQTRLSLHRLWRLSSLGPHPTKVGQDLQERPKERLG